jgi:AraC-like DNA-binding protein
LVTYKKYLDIEIFEGEIDNHQYPWHYHNCYTIIFVEKGLIEYELQGQFVTIGEGEVFIIEPLEVHRNTITKSTLYKAFFIPIEYFGSSEKCKICTGKVSRSTLSNKIIQFLNTEELKYSRKEIKDFISGLRELLNQTKTLKINSFNSRIKTVPKINIDLSIKKLSEEAHLSKFHYQRKFKQECGLTIGQLKQQEKTLKAKTLLESGQFSTNVAYELGFFDQSHFIKSFRKMWAVTPKFFKK